MDIDRSHPKRVIHRPTPEEWKTLAAVHGRDIVEVVRPLVDGDGLIKLSDQELSSRAEVGIEEARVSLSDFARRGILSEERIQSCGCCSTFLTPEDAQEERCPDCGQALIDCGVTEGTIHVRSATPGRDVAWVLVLHGMNTTGAWQEELSWSIANTYERTVPVFIYKYGRVRPGVFLRWRQRQLVKELHQKVEKLRATYGAASSAQPDVLAHSFGSWLIGHVLMDDPELRFGRVVLAGSILRPDFDWVSVTQRGQVEAVLNHCGGQDRWVPLAKLVIPDAGPSGTKGFLDPGVINRIEPDFGHSSFFEEGRIASNLADVWGLFFRRPHERLDELRVGSAGSSWRPFPNWIQLLLRGLLLGILGGGFLILLALIVIGAAAAVT